MPKKIDRSSADRTQKAERVLELAIQDGQKQLESFLQLSIGADQRGVTLGGIYLGAAAAVLAAIFPDFRLSSPDQITIAFCIMLLGAGGCLCLYSALPMRIYGVGEIPDFYVWAKENKKTYYELLELMLDRYKDKVEDSNLRGAKKAKLFKYGLYIGASAPIFAWLYYVHSMISS